MATLALAKDLLLDYHKLEKRTRSKVSEIVTKFQTRTAHELRADKGTHLEPHVGAADSRARTVRITDNLRGIVLDVGDDEHFVLAHIGTHDATDLWMANNTFRANVATGALEIYDAIAVGDAVRSAPTTVEASPAPSLFAHRRDKDFTQLGIDEDLIVTLRAFTNEDQLMGLLSVLPEGQAQAAIELMGQESVEAIYASVAGSFEPGSIAPDDLATALTTPASQSRFHVVADEDELQEMLAQPLATWRTYLHHTQHDLAYRDWNGPARVTGGAGTGKTVVAIHRAHHLADQLTDRTDKTILFTTFTRNLAQSIEQDLRDLGGTDTLEVIEVLNVDRLAHRIVREAEGENPTPIGGPDLDQLWKTVVAERGTDLSPEFLANEWEQVILAQDCKTRDDYFTASRAGRGIPLDRRDRAEVWKVIEALNRRLADLGRRSYVQLAADAAGYLAARSDKPYQHVVVDEAQDLHEAQWRLLRAAVPEQPNDMFIVGDSHQRIYDRRSSLSKVGIKIVGRSKKLRINYRTTYEILSWAMALLGEDSYEFDDLDGGDDRQTFAGYHSLVHGSRPVPAGAASMKEQLDSLVAQVRAWIDDGVLPEDIGVAARNTTAFDEITKVLENSAVPVCRLDNRLPTGDGVRLGTMHRMKGLEFRCVAVVNCDDDRVPARYALSDRDADPVQHRIDLQRELCLLYVACTRAREALWVGWSGRPSRFLGPVLGQD